MYSTEQLSLHETWFLAPDFSKWAIKIYYKKCYRGRVPIIQPVWLSVSDTDYWYRTGSGLYTIYRLQSLVWIEYNQIRNKRRETTGDWRKHDIQESRTDRFWEFSRILTRWAGGLLKRVNRTELNPPQQWKTLSVMNRHHRLLLRRLDIDWRWSRNLGADITVFCIPLLTWISQTPSWRESPALAHWSPARIYVRPADRLYRKIGNNPIKTDWMLGMCWKTYPLTLTTRLCWSVCRSTSVALSLCTKCSERYALMTTSEQGPYL